MHHPTYKIVHTTAFVTPVVEHWLEREIAQWVHPMKDQFDDPSHHERTLLPRIYISFPEEEEEEEEEEEGEEEEEEEEEEEDEEEEDKRKVTKKKKKEVDDEEVGEEEDRSMPLVSI